MPTAPRESPPRGAKDKANERIAAQLAQRTNVPVAEVVRSPESSPDGPLAPPPAAARAGAGIVDVTGGDSDDSDGSPLRPLRGLGLKTTGLELGDSSPNFSPSNNSPESPTDNEVSKYSFFARLMHMALGKRLCLRCRRRALNGTKISRTTMGRPRKTTSSKMTFSESCFKC